MKRIITLFSITAVLAIASCDTVEDPIIVVGSQYQDWIYGEAPEFEPAQGDMIVQKILLEDFTGHKCGNCPSAAITATELKENNPDQVVLLAVHAGELAQPDGQDYPTDLTTEVGEIWFDELPDEINPSGRINRAPDKSIYWLAFQWDDEVESHLDESPGAIVQVETEFFADAQHLNIHVFSEMMEDVEGQVKMVVAISEDGIIGDQLDYSIPGDTHVEDYHFEHVLRGTVNGTHGVIIGENMLDGQTAQNDYTFEWNSAWDVQNSNVIAIVYQESCIDDEGNPIESCGRILNVEEVHIYD